MGEGIRTVYTSVVIDHTCASVGFSHFKSTEVRRSRWMVQLYGTQHAKQVRPTCFHIGCHCTCLVDIRWLLSFSASDPLPFCSFPSFSSSFFLYCRPVCMMEILGNASTLVIGLVHAHSDSPIIAMTGPGGVAWTRHQVAGLLICKYHVGPPK